MVKASIYHGRLAKALAVRSGVEFKRGVVTKETTVGFDLGIAAFVFSGIYIFLFSRPHGVVFGLSLDNGKTWQMHKRMLCSKRERGYSQ